MFLRCMHGEICITAESLFPRQLFRAPIAPKGSRAKRFGRMHDRLQPSPVVFSAAEEDLSHSSSTTTTTTSTLSQTTNPLSTTHHATTITRKRSHLRRRHGATPRQPTLATTFAARISPPDHPRKTQDRPFLRVDEQLRDPRRLQQRQERPCEGVDGLRPFAGRRRLPGAEAATVVGDAPRRPIPLAVDAAVVRPAGVLSRGNVGQARPHHRRAEPLVALGTLHTQYRRVQTWACILTAEQLSGASN